MPDFEQLTEERRKAIAETIQTISAEQLQSLGEGLFPYHDHPWREKFFTFITENANAGFYHAQTDDRIHVIYCHSKNRGMWFVPGSGMGPVQEKSLQILKEAVENLR
jgi:hypothetical protein